MTEKKKLIYSFSEHGLYYENNDNQNDSKKVILTIGTAQLEFDYNIRNLLSVSGYLPLFKAVRKYIDIPQYVEDLFCISMNNIEYLPGVAYDYFDYFEESKEYIMIDEYNPKLYYDESNKRILMGTKNEEDTCIKINKNIICGLDGNRNLKYLLISLDKVIK